MTILAEMSWLVDALPQLKPGERVNSGLEFRIVDKTYVGFTGKRAELRGRRAWRLAGVAWTDGETMPRWTWDRNVVFWVFIRGRTLRVSEGPEKSIRAPESAEAVFSLWLRP